MSITKQKTGKYLLNIRPNGLKGKQVKKLFDTKREALSYQKLVLSGELEKNKVDNSSLSHLLHLWYRNHGYSLKSANDTYARLKRLCFLLGDPVASMVDGALYSDYRNSRILQGIKPATLNRELATLKSCYRELMRLDLYTGDAPILKVRKFKEVQTELSYLQYYDEISDLLHECRESSNSSLYPVVLLCLLTGARWSESEGVKLSDLKNQSVTFSNTKNGKVRYVPLDEKYFVFFQEFLSQRKCFDSCYSAFRSAFNRSGLTSPKGQMAHILRHTFASHFIINGGNILALQKILGHSSLVVTTRYAHLSPDHLREATYLNPIDGF